MLHPSDGGAPVPLLKSGRYSSQVIDIAKSGKVGWGSETREQRRTRIARERAIAAALTPDLSKAIDDAIAEAKLQQQNAGLLLLPDETVPDNESIALKKEQERRARQAVRQHYRDEREKDQKAAADLAALIQHSLEKSGAKELIDYIAKGNGITPEEVVRRQVASDGTVEGKIAGLEVGDKITDKFRPDHPWVVERRNDGQYELVSRGGRIPLDHLNPSERVKQLVRDNKVLTEHPITEGEVERAAYEAPYIVHRNELVDETKSIQSGQQVIPEPTSQAQAESHLAAAEDRVAATIQNAADAQAKATNPPPGTSESQIEINVAEAENAKSTAEAAVQQEAEAFSRTVPDAPYARPLISIERRGNPGFVIQNGVQFPVHFEMVPLDAPVTSHRWEGNEQVPREGFTGNLQPRTISKEQALGNLRRGAIPQAGSEGGYNFDLYADRTPSALNGPALLDQGGETITGSTRIEIMRQYVENLKAIQDPVAREVA